MHASRCAESELEVAPRRARMQIEPEVVDQLPNMYPELKRAK